MNPTRPNVEAHREACMLDGKLDSLVTYCVYQIATGKWREGDRLPSVREGERVWQVDRRTVMKAYRRLERQGLVVVRERSGYFVASGPGPGRLARHRHELESLFDRLSRIVIDETGLSPLGVFRYCARLAEARGSNRPECAFVECTRSQAEGHATEVREHLSVPCVGLSLSEIEGRRCRIPGSIRTLLVSPFHLGEISDLDDTRNLTLRSVPVELSVDLTRAIPKGAREAVICEWDATEARSLLQDVESLGLSVPLRFEVVEDLAVQLEEWTARDGTTIYLPSPRLYGSLPGKWIDHPRVIEARFRICDAAWPAIADAIGLPLGTFG